jgi:hypothetical protein
MNLEQVRLLALALPEAEEYEHGGLSAFRVRGTRFASMLDEDGINLMLGEQGIEAAVAVWPTACAPMHFAGRLAAVRVDFRKLADDDVHALLHEAWAAKAPKRLL